MRYLCLILFVCLLSACVKPKYTYMPPHDRTCIARCVQGKSYCESLCYLKNPRCLAQAERDLAAYQTEQRVQGLAIKKTLKDFQTDKSCQSSCQCVKAYNTCYSACGGQVLEQ